MRKRAKKKKKLNELHKRRRATVERCTELGARDPYELSQSLGHIIEPSIDPGKCSAKSIANIAEIRRGR